MNASQISKWLCDQVILKSEKRDKKGRNTIKWIQPHIIKWMLRGGLRTAELITSSGVRRDVNNSVFVAGIKTDTRLDMEPREWTRSQATKTQLSPPRDGASNGQVPRPQISTTEHSGNLSVKTGARNVSTLTEKTKKSTTDVEKVNMSRFETVRVWRVSPLLLGVSVWSSLGSEPARPVLWDTQTYANNFPPREEDDPSNTENLSHPLQRLSWPLCKHHSQFLLEEQVIPVIIQNGMSCSVKRRFSCRSKKHQSILTFHQTNISLADWSVV